MLLYTSISYESASYVRAYLVLIVRKNERDGRAAAIVGMTSSSQPPEGVAEGDTCNGWVYTCISEYIEYLIIVMMIVDSGNLGRSTSLELTWRIGGSTCDFH